MVEDSLDGKGYVNYNEFFESKMNVKLFITQERMVRVFQKGLTFD